MHPPVLEWVARWATSEPVTVLDIGGRDINGTCRHLFPHAAYTVLDIVDAPGVDIVADAATWQPDHRYDLVLCTEVFEHTPTWPMILATARKACKQRLIVTCAAPHRPEHSGLVEGPLQPGEHYRNIPPEEMADVLERDDWRDIEVEVLGADLRATARV